MNLDLISLKLNKILPILIRYKALLATLFVVGICGYTAYQISIVVAVAPDAVTLQQEQDSAAFKAIKFDTTTIHAITQQNQVNVAPNLSGIGTTNPFFGN